MIVRAKNTIVCHLSQKKPSATTLVLSCTFYMLLVLVFLSKFRSTYNLQTEVVTPNGARNVLERFGLARVWT